MVILSSPGVAWETVLDDEPMVKHIRLLRIDIKSKEGLELFGGRGARIFSLVDHLALAITGHAMRIDSQDFTGVMAQGIAEFAQH